jgi:hypothetical protein
MASIMAGLPIRTRLPPSGQEALSIRAHMLQSPRRTVSNRQTPGSGLNFDVLVFRDLRRRHGRRLSEHGSTPRCSGRAPVPRHRPRQSPGDKSSSDHKPTTRPTSAARRGYRGRDYAVDPPCLLLLMPTTCTSSSARRACPSKTRFHAVPFRSPTTQRFDRGTSGGPRCSPGASYTIGVPARRTSTSSPPSCDNVHQNRGAGPRPADGRNYPYSGHPRVSRRDGHRAR